ncbi:branched-chain amino acid aminotransferase [Pseudochryseolinea flava]|uniref:branched-chain-amino-acid transaminase n=1 Tax=Pseudochryseolinea flava TaxID=2059302 RepID=A0A364XW87_9BACT|nr:branched-chain amino acid aminotransferase [Pseudochryseolinea flava]RAV97784.1 branched chain amino acid aminotransferase [Pseudochryseolinea flava]
MVDTIKITLEGVTESRLPQTDFNNLPFGKVYTDHMFMADYRDGQWKNFRIVPYGHMLVSPATPAIHYGQSIFEGMKAYLGTNGEVLIFRPHDNLQRLNLSADRMCMPPVPEEIFMEGLRELLHVDKAWIPSAPGSSLYIRPFVFSADEYIGIRPSQDFTFMIIMSPVGAYYSNPVKVKIETHYTRAVAGGTGYAKAGGNYGGAIYPTKLAAQEGFHQLIWTDGVKHEYIEESGTMNVMFVFNDTLVTPALSDSILAGITRDSIVKLAQSWGMKVEERKVSVKEIVAHLTQGTLQEAFGVGTAATIANIEAIGYEGNLYTLPPVEQRVIAHKIYQELDAIKRGTQPDRFGWIMKL